VTSNRQSLSRQQRNQRIADARTKLEMFLNDLDPVVRKCLLGREALTIDETRQVGLLAPPERQKTVSDARLMFEHLLIEIPVEWNRYCKRQPPVYKLLAEYRLRGKVPRRGAPRKAAETSEAVLVTQKYSEVAERLEQGVALRRQLRAAGGARSDDTEIRTKLREIAYSDDECLAVLRSKSLKGAAVWLLARQLKRKPNSIRSSLDRAAKKGWPAISKRSYPNNHT